MLVVFEKDHYSPAWSSFNLGGGLATDSPLSCKSSSNSLRPLESGFAVCGQQGPPNNMLQNPHQDGNYPMIIFNSRFTTSSSQAKEADVLA